MVHIYFGTSTFDRVEKGVKFYIKKLVLTMNFDFKVTLVGQLGLIGGTMGLFTGFSPVLRIEFGPPHINFGSVWSP